MDYQDKNITALHTNSKMQQDKLVSLEEKVRRIEAAVAALQGDIANTKQLIGHVAGRGMGSTTE
jgi:peptidoglycan hydrolase CwlO-like protein